MALLIGRIDGRMGGFRVDKTGSMLAKMVQIAGLKYGLKFKVM